MTLFDKLVYISAIEEALMKQTTPENIEEQYTKLTYCDDLIERYNRRVLNFSKEDSDANETAANETDANETAANETAAEEPTPTVESAEPVEEPKVEVPYVEPTPFPEPKEETPAPAPAPAAVPATTVTLTKADVKQKLIALQNSHGVDIAEVMQSLGHSKLSDFAESEYADLIAAAEAKVKQ